MLIKKLDEVRFFKLEKKWLWRLLEITLKTEGLSMASLVQGWAGAQCAESAETVLCWA